MPNKMPTGKKLQKLFFIAVVSLLICCVQNLNATENSTVPEKEKTEKAEQARINYSDDNSTEVDYVQESKLARKMSREDKEKNAKTYDSMGGGISIIAMCIVVSALAVLSILFMIFGRISSRFIKKKKKQSASKAKKTTAEEEDDHSPDSGETIAAITAALAQHFDRNHDIENTILTIHKMRKAYSPWNSKIYNMRHTPEFTHHAAPQPKKK